MNSPTDTPSQPAPDRPLCWCGKVSTADVLDHEQVFGHPYQPERRKVASSYTRNEYGELVKRRDRRQPPAEAPKPLPALRRMKGNPLAYADRFFPRNYKGYHSVEHDETVACAMLPACEPVAAPAPPPVTAEQAYKYRQERTVSILNVDEYAAEFANSITADLREQLAAEKKRRLDDNAALKQERDAYKHLSQKLKRDAESASERQRDIVKLLGDIHWYADTNPQIVLDHAIKTIAQRWPQGSEVQVRAATPSPEVQRDAVSKTTSTEPLGRPEGTAPSCHYCGAIMSRIPGSKEFKCGSCGTVTGVVVAGVSNQTMAGAMAAFQSPSPSWDWPTIERALLGLNIQAFPGRYNMKLVAECLRGKLHEPPASPAVAASPRPFDGDGHAWEVLRNHFYEQRGIIVRKDKTRTPTRREYEAIDYLCSEWDYEWLGLELTPAAPQQPSGPRRAIALDLEETENGPSEQPRSPDNSCGVTARGGSVTTPPEAHSPFRRTMPLRVAALDTASTQSGPQETESNTETFRQTDGQAVFRLQAEQPGAAPPRDETSEPVETLYCDDCENELQREACSHVRRCEHCWARDAAALRARLQQAEGLLRDIEPFLPTLPQCSEKEYALMQDIRGRLAAALTFEDSK